MKNIFIALFMFISCMAYSNPDFKLYHEQSSEGIMVYADNNEFCPISIELNLNLKNMISTEPNKKIFVVPPQSKKFLITRLNAKNKKKKYSFGMESMVNYGNHHLNTYDEEYNYFLPYPTGESYDIWQGYNGKFSHQKENALDFGMPEGTHIYSVREGVVVDVVQKHNKHCGEEKCQQYNNYIRIFHPDGTFAEYAHIQKNGSKVKKGDTVEKGQFIALSGNTGWSTAPHLHLVIYLAKLQERKTLETKFLVEDGQEAVILKEKNSYTRGY